MLKTVTTETGLIVMFTRLTQWYMQHQDKGRRYCSVLHQTVIYCQYSRNQISMN